MKNVLLIAGTRPNFIKLAPLFHRLAQDALAFKPYICHTGQHFDFNMSDVFWKNLELPSPDFQLNIKGNGVADTIGKTILGINEVVGQNSFDLLIVFGDVNATAAGAIVGAQSRIPVMHVEAGLRSFDRDMPEEINRIMTDHVSDFLMISEPSGITNLKREGFPDSKLVMVGNIMIECLIQTRARWERTELQDSLRSVLEKRPVIATFHRPENVDDPKALERVVTILRSCGEAHPVVFPVHPRTRAKLEESGLARLLQNVPNILLTDPLSYFEFLKLVSGSALVITDSGGVQEETSFLNIPCITFRKNTERPVTITQGTNMLLSIYEDDFFAKITRHRENIENRARCAIPLWDDGVSGRIVEFIKKTYQ